MTTNREKANSIQVANTKTVMTWACITATAFLLVSISPLFIPDMRGDKINAITVTIAAMNTAVFVWRRAWAGRALSHRRPKPAFKIRPSSNAVEPERKITALSIILIVLIGVAMSAGKDGALPLPAALASIIVPLILISPLLDVFGSKADAWQ